MRILVLGGTLFLSHQIALEALRRGHQVTCANRGVSGAVPAGATQVVLDRSGETDPEAPVWTDLAAGDWDAVVDVARTPSWVRTALRALAPAGPHWLFVSSVSTYADLSQPGGSAEDTPLLAPAPGDLDDSDPEAYGRNKVACEEAVRAVTKDRCLVVRPGLIVGPGDPSGRFTYWPVRLARGGTVLAPAPPEALTQVVDVRDLAAWLVSCCEESVTGTLDGVGPVQRLDELLDAVAAGVGSDPAWHWAEPARLAELDVQPWAGPRSLPLWLPGADHAGTAARDDSAAVAAGLRCRPIADTARDTLAWVRDTPHASVTGLTLEQEREVLRDS